MTTSGDNDSNNDSNVQVRLADRAPARALAICPITDLAEAYDGAPMLTSGSLTLDRAILEKLLAHAAAAARIVGHLEDAPAIGPLADHVDAIVHELSELLGEPHRIAAPVPSARPAFDDDITQRIESVPMAALVESGVR
jgi:hypothetical protein